MVFGVLLLIWPSTGILTLVWLVGIFTLAGGTGRFSDASGTATASVRQEVVSVVGTTVTTRDKGTLKGRISY